MFQKIISLRITNKRISDWLTSEKSTGRSINTIINEAIKEKMDRDNKKAMK